MKLNKFEIWFQRYMRVMIAFMFGIAFVKVGEKWPSWAAIPVMLFMVCLTWLFEKIYPA